MRSSTRSTNSTSRRRNRPSSSGSASGKIIGRDYSRTPWHHTDAFEAEETPMSTPAAATSARNEVRGVAPKLIELSEKVLYGDVWERPGLSKRDRSLITVAALTALYRSDQLKGHIERALANGVTREEISEVITHMAFYSGWPTAMTAARIAKGVFEEKKS